MSFGTNTSACIGADDAQWSDSDDSGSSDAAPNRSGSESDDSDPITSDESDDFGGIDKRKKRKKKKPNLDKMRDEDLDFNRDFAGILDVDAESHPGRVSDYSQLQGSYAGHPNELVAQKARSLRRQRRQRAKLNRQQQRSTAYWVPKPVPFPNRRIQVVQISCGGDIIGAHTLALTRHGRVFAWGYGPATGTGTSENVSKPKLVTKYYGFPNRGKHVETNGADEILGWGPFSRKGRWLSKPSRITRAGMQVQYPRIVKIAAGGSFSISLTNDGEVYTWGLSASGRSLFSTPFYAFD